MTNKNHKPADTFNLSEKIEEVRRFFSKEHGVWNDEIIDKIEEDVKTFIKKLKAKLGVKMAKKPNKIILEILEDINTLAGEDLK